MTTDFDATATAILARAAVLWTDDEEELRAAIVEALEKTRREAIEAACRALCPHCAAGELAVYSGTRWVHPGIAPDDTGDKGEWGCLAAPIRRLMEP